MTRILTLLTLFALGLILPRAALPDDSAYGVRLIVQSPDGPLSFLIGDSLERDASAGTLTMTGHVQVRREPDLLLDAQKVIATTYSTQNVDAAQSTGGLNLNNISQLAKLQLVGQVFAKVGQVQIQGPDLSIDTQNQTIHAPAGPVTIRNGDQYLQAGGGLRGDLIARTFYGFGGVSALVNGTQVKAEKLQVTLPPEGATNQPPQIIASGDVRFWGQGFDLVVGRIQSSPDGTLLYLSGGLTYVGTQGSFTAGSGVINLQTQEFTLDRSTDSPIRAQGFLGE